jgi:hypothetical protein
MDMQSLAPWRKSREDKEAVIAQANKIARERQMDVAVFQRAFGVDDETRTADQKRMVARLRRMCGVDNPVFIFQVGQLGDPLRAAQNDGRRDVFFSIMDFVNTKTEE